MKKGTVRFEFNEATVAFLCLLSLYGSVNVSALSFAFKVTRKAHPLILSASPCILHESIHEHVGPGRAYISPLSPIDNLSENCLLSETEPPKSGGPVKY